MTQSTSTEPKSLWQALSRPILTLLALQLMGGMLLSPHFAFFSIYLKELGYSTILIANIATAKQIAGLIASLLGGTLSDSLGRKRTLLLGNAGYLLASFVFLLDSPAGIGILWTVGGFGLGLHTLGAQSYLMDVAASGFLGLLSALFNWGYTLGGAISSPVVGLLLDRGGYSLLAWTLIAFTLLTLAVNQFALPRSPIENRAATPRLKHLFGYGDIATRPPVLMLAALRFLPTLAYATMVLLVPLMLDDAKASKAVVAWYATVSLTTASLAQAVVGRAADRWGPKPATAATFAALIASAFGLALWPSSLWAVFALGTSGLAAAWALSTLLPSLVAEATVPQERGRVLGFIHLWWNLAMITGSLAGGALAEIAIGLPFWIAGALNLLSLLLLFVFYRRVARTRA
ncbi:MAG: MFS transporter [Anaerolineae bacterium]|nr:MFS transporter [Anaerolineae bacterium]